MSGADRPQQNVYVIATPEQWPERPDPFILYNQTYAPGAGVYQYDPTLERYFMLARAADALGAFAYSSYASMLLDNPPVAGADIATIYQDITQYGREPVVARGIRLFLATGNFSFDLPGVYVISGTYVFQHNELNVGRDVSVRLYNVTDTAEVDDILTGTGRNVDTTSINFTVMADIGVADIDKRFVIQIGRATTDYTNVQWQTTNLSIWSVGEYRGELSAGTFAWGIEQLTVTTTGYRPAANGPNSGGDLKPNVIGGLPVWELIAGGITDTVQLNFGDAGGQQIENVNWITLTFPGAPLVRLQWNGTEYTAVDSFFADSVAAAVGTTVDLTMQFYA